MNALQDAKLAFDKVLNHLKDEFAKLQIGRASAGLVEGLLVEAYGMTQPMKSLASISIPDARTIQIQPWDRALLGAIEKAIENSDIDIRPTNNGVCIILSIPMLTEERRRDLVKVVGRMSEEARISVRNARHEAMTSFKRMEHEGEMSEDEQARNEKQLQECVEKVNAEIEDLAKKKEESILTL